MNGSEFPWHDTAGEAAARIRGSMGEAAAGEGRFAHAQVRLVVLAPRTSEMSGKVRPAERATAESSAGVLSMPRTGVPTHRRGYAIETAAFVLPEAAGDARVHMEITCPSHLQSCRCWQPFESARSEE